jgi:hypothetical protein
MLANRKVISGYSYGLTKELSQYVDESFEDFEQHTVVPGAIYVISYHQLRKHADTILNLAAADVIKLVLIHPAEGSETFINHCNNISNRILALSGRKKILLISGGSLPSEYPHMVYEYFLPKILDYTENIDAIKTYSNNNSTIRPYKFLFLNGRERYHRRFMIYNLSELLDSAIWSNLDRQNGPVKLLDSKYEYSKFNVDFTIGNHNANTTKDKLFGPGIWGEVYLNAKPYSDTYFSLVTETVHACPYSFRTEKIWKPIAMGHPWIAVANRGYYKDMHNLGFKTFKHVINERFDFIENNNDRLERVSDVVKDLCQQDLASFLKECYNVCKYNQQHLAEMRTIVRDEFPKRFEQFVTKYINE